MLSKVFLSHNSNDKEIVRRLNDDIQKAGIQTWFDEAELLPGDYLINKIDKAISQKCKVLIVCLTKNSISSDWVRTEIRWALESDKIKVIPVSIYCFIDGIDKKCKKTD